MPGIFNFTGNCFPVSKKRSARMRQGTFFIESQKSCTGQTDLLILYRNQASSGVHLNFRKKNGILFVAPARFLYRRDAEETRKG